ncbi:LD-carboxypeptidase [Agriterribacter sp.]|uniref:S66 peptidase family protein n=1 Tax=Agriterribacter sp. TaxID=2821509 RepID=UPI002C3671AE|nr:LD-carboxypeptidase [Agriterribacter sp.]HRO47595.1 LD-carboxypeptidase [Agriterribacter sp.]HRQ18696.1 LD-carboxypeptidase [Agriterribacter sp.]
MNRKHFLSSLFTTGISVKALAATLHNPDPSIRIPQHLKPGDAVAITAPAGHITVEELQPAIKQIESWGLKIRLGDTIGKKDFSFGGTDAERAADFQRMLDDPAVKAIMCARGGYGSIRIIDQLNFSKFLIKPKWIIGFSDITVMHCHIGSNYKVATIHSKMCNSFPEDWSKAEPLQRDTILSIKDALTGVKMKYNALPHEKNRHGIIEGTLTGGNLKIIENLAGSKSEIKTAGKILFVEDTGEYLYSIDRMFWNLQRTGKLSQLKALIIGGFRIKPDDPGEEFGRTLYDIVWEKVKTYNYPVCFDFPVGHQRNNYALKCGVLHRLSVTANGVELLEV